MTKNRLTLPIPPNRRPKVLLLGNGLLRLSQNCISWDHLLNEIRTRNVDSTVSDNIPKTIQPELFCGTNVEYIQRLVAGKIKDVDPIPSQLRDLLALPFDAILTTNYTYEIEFVLSGGKWSDQQARQAFTILNDKPRARNNTFACNVVKTMDKRMIPVFHIHGEKRRHQSLITSYYSYAQALYRLIDYNKALKNSLQDCQIEQKVHPCQCWLDYFLLGDVYIVGLGLDPAEFDIWWAIERKSREKANHGETVAYFPNAETSGKDELLRAMDARAKTINVDHDDYKAYYQSVIEDIAKAVNSDRTTT